MGKKRKNKKGAEPKAVESSRSSCPINMKFPAIIYSAPEDRTLTKRQPVIIPPGTFETLAEYMLRTVPSQRNVFLSVNEYSIKDINPLHLEDDDSPTHVLFFCLRLIVTDQFHPIGLVQINKKIDQTEKLVNIWKAFLQDLSILRLIVIGSISPANTTFHKILETLTLNPDMGDSTEPILYSVWPFKSILHLYSYHHLLHDIQETLFKCGEMSFITCNTHLLAQSSRSLELWNAGWSDILPVLDALGIDRDQIEERVNDGSITIFSLEFWKAYKTTKLNDTTTKYIIKSTDRMMELFCSFLSLLNIYQNRMCPDDLKVFYDNNEDLRCLLASAKFRAFNDLDSQKRRCATILKRLAEIEAGDFEESDWLKEFSGANSKEQGHFLEFLRKITYDEFDFFLKTSRQSISSQSTWDEQADEQDITEAPHQDHNYVNTNINTTILNTRSRIYNVVNDYFGEALKQYKMTCPSTTEADSKDINPTLGQTEDSIDLKSNLKEASACTRNSNSSKINSGNSVDKLSNKNTISDPSMKDLQCSSGKNKNSKPHIVNCPGLDKIANIEIGINRDRYKIAKAKTKTEWYQKRKSNQKLVPKIPYFLSEKSASMMNKTDVKAFKVPNAAPDVQPVALIKVDNSSKDILRINIFNLVPENDTSCFVSDQTKEQELFPTSSTSEDTTVNLLENKTEPFCTVCNKEQDGILLESQEDDLTTWIMKSAFLDFSGITENCESQLSGHRSNVVPQIPGSSNDKQPSVSSVETRCNATQTINTSKDNPSIQSITIKAEHSVKFNQSKEESGLMQCCRESGSSRQTHDLSAHYKRDKKSDKPNNDDISAEAEDTSGSRRRPKRYSKKTNSKKAKELRMQGTLDKSKETTPEKSAALKKLNDFIKNWSADQLFVEDEELDYGPGEPIGYIDYNDYKKSLEESCSNHEVKHHNIYQDQENFERLYKLFPEGYETKRVTNDWLCTLKGYVQLKEILVERKVKAFHFTALSLEHIDFFIHLIKKNKNKVPSVYVGPSFKILDQGCALKLISGGTGLYVIQNEE